MLEETYAFLQSSPIAKGLVTLAATMAIIGGIHGFVKFVAVSYRKLFPAQLSARELRLHAEWSNSHMIHRKTIRSGDTLEGTYERGAQLVLSLSNAGRMDLTNLILQISGNAKFDCEPSSDFDDGVRLEPRDQSSHIWHSQPGVVFQKNAPARRFGSISWDRDKGEFWAFIQAFARDLPERAEFFVALRPSPTRPD